MKLNAVPTNRPDFLEDCPLCTIPFHEKLIYSDDQVYICETKDKKGHKNRIMIVSNKHERKVSRKFTENAIQKLIEKASKIFTEEWIIVRGMTTVPDHWHLVAEDTASTDPKEAQLIKTASIVWNSEHKGKSNPQSQS